MDVFNPDTWKQQWTAFMSAPFIMLPLIAGAVWVGWWLRGTKSEGKIAGLDERIAVFEDRLKLAAEQSASADRAKDEVEKQFQAYKAEVAAKAEYDVLAATAAKVEAAIDDLESANNAVSSAVSGILSAAEGADIANFRGTVGKAKE
jgi:hypothetical protein